MAMVTGIVPVVGVPLPFISYGGSSLILNIISVTFLLRISYDNSAKPRRGRLTSNRSRSKERRLITLIFYKKSVFFWEEIACNNIGLST